MNREDRCQQPTKELLVIPPLPPTDLMYLAAIAETCGFEAMIKDYSLGGNLSSDIETFRPDYLVANIATPTFKSDMEAVANAKSKLPNLITIVKGAPFLTYNTNVIYENPFIDYVIYGEPEIAWVGLREQDCDDTYEKRMLPITALGKSWCDDATDGFIKLILKDDYIVGAHIVSKEASAMIKQLVIAIQNKICVDKLKEICVAHPTYSEGLYEVLG